MNAKEMLQKLGYTLPTPPQRGGLYTHVRIVGKLVFVSGIGTPMLEDKEYRGKVGKDVDPETAKRIAEQCALSILSCLDFNVGLENIKSLVRLYGMVQSAEGFVKQPKVIDGASALFNQIFPDSTGHTRMAVGTNQLPENLPVEIETVFELC